MKAFVLGIFLMMGTMSMAGRMVDDFNGGWKFHLGDEPAAKDAAFNDSDWREVTVPHDWSVEHSFTQEMAGGCTAFLPGGVGWYRKTFALPKSGAGKQVRVEFDGVYNNSEVWINGHPLGKRPYGYISFAYDLTPYLKFGGKNVIAVRADRTAYMDCRWYPGSGIYRAVSLVATDPVHVARHGVFVTTENNEKVMVRTTVVNTSKGVAACAVKTDLQDAEGKSVGFQVTEVSLPAGAEQDVRQEFVLAEPKVWDTENPHLYVAEVALVAGDETMDNVETPFGVRDLRYDPATGFYLNGKSTLLKGVCLHHDAGAVGAAVPDAVWEHRLQLLKEVGCNAIRTAHNPPSAAFLDLCDRMGFLVQDEAFDEWFNPKDKKNNFNQRATDDRTIGYSESFGEWAERDVKEMVLRDRNHPSVIMWSIGNEIEWTYPGYSPATGYWEDENNVNYYWDLPPYDEAKRKKIFAESDQGAHILAEQAADLARWIKEVDVSRPVTANLVMPSISHFSGYADALDIVGYSYRTALNKWGHEHYPEKMILGTENWVQWNEWKSVLENDHIPGIFMWTGIDYLGESQDWPRRSSGSGMIDTAGFRKPNFWFFKTFWNEAEPMVHIETRPLADSNYVLKAGGIVENPERPRTRKWGWPALDHHWNHAAEAPIYVEVYSNTEETELFLNGTSLGALKLADQEDRLHQWVVPFAAGELKAVGRNQGTVVAEQRLQTAGEPVALKLSTNRGELAADGEDVARCVVQLVDANDVPVRNVDRKINFSLLGDASFIGVDNGAGDNVQDFQADRCVTSGGRVVILVEAGTRPGSVMVTAESSGLEGARAGIVLR